MYVIQQETECCSFSNLWNSNFCGEGRNIVFLFRFPQKVLNQCLQNIYDDSDTRALDPLTLSPSTSGKSFVTAITVANIVMKRAIKETLGLHVNGAPIASLTA